MFSRIDQLAMDDITLELISCHEMPMVAYSQIYGTYNFSRNRVFFRSTQISEFRVKSAIFNLKSRTWSENLGVDSENIGPKLKNRSLSTELFNK